MTDKAAAADGRTGVAGARRILICARWGIGDLVMELPLLDALRQHVPRAHITALAARPAVELLEHQGVVDHVVEVQRFGLEHWGDAGDEKIRRDIARWCRESGFDCVLDGSHAPRGAHLALDRVGLPWFDTGPYLQTPRGSPESSGDGLALLADAARNVWGIAPAEARPRLRLREQERAAAQRFISGVGDDQTPLIGLAPVASHPLKRGRAGEFAKAADALVASTGAHVLLFVGAEGREGERVRAAMRHADRAHLIEPVHLRLTAALIERCRLLLCNDTGLMHLAASVGVSVVAVFACTSPSLYLPPDGVAVPRWTEPCRHLEAERGRFGVTPCVAAGYCLDREHRRTEKWADAAAESASALWRRENY